MRQLGGTFGFWHNKKIKKESNTHFKIYTSTQEKYLVSTKKYSSCTENRYFAAHKMQCVSYDRLEVARASCIDGSSLNGDAVHMLVEQVVGICACRSGATCLGGVHVVAPATGTHFFASHSATWGPGCTSRDTLSHIEEQLSQQVRKCLVGVASE